MNDGGIHYENPFVDPPEDRSDPRRLRGRLALPVTVWTAGTVEEPIGLTISSLVVSDGEPAIAAALIGETSDLFLAVQETRSFVVHVLEEDDFRLAEIFAGLRPNPGGLFAGIDIESSPWGPVIASHGTRAFCKLQTVTDAGYHKLVVAKIEKIELGELDSPAVYFRGRFRRLAPDNRRPSS